MIHMVCTYNLWSKIGSSHFKTVASVEAHFIVLS